MARKGVFNNNKSRLLLILSLVAVLCFSLFFVACSDKKSSETERPTYSHTQTDDSIITNKNFTTDTFGADFTTFPKSSPSGWSKIKDSDSDISQASATSGVVNVTDKAWTELLNQLFKDTALLDYTLYENGITMTDVKNQIIADTTYNPNKSDSFNVTDEMYAKYVVEKYLKNAFVNPSVHANSTDNVVYMLNNYRSGANVGLGTSQYIVSSSDITLEKGEYGKFTLWVKTANLSAKNNDYGANIRIVNTFDGKTQADYVVKNIRVTDWTEYTVYVKGDEHFDTKVKLAMGLGYGLDGLTQGTAYFDDVNFEKIDADTYNSATSSLYETKLSFGAKKLEPTNVATSKAFAYSMNVDKSSYLKTSSDTGSATYTKSNSSLTADRFEDSALSYTNSTDSAPYKNAKVMKLALNNTSATITFNSFPAINCEGYAYVTFFVKNQLNKFGSTNVSFNVYDMLTGKTDIINKNVVSVTDVNDEWQQVAFVVKNNFVKDNDSSTTYDVARNFKVEVIVGPTDIANSIYKDDFASGELYITAPLYATGNYYSTSSSAEDANELDNYNFFSLYQSSSQKTISLFAGLSDGDIDDESSHDHNTFKVSPSDLGAIISRPAVPKGYQGIVAKHIYVNEGSNLETKINTRVNGENGSYAGLINSKYDYSSISGLKTALNFTPAPDDHVQEIQPLMIYNSTLDNYGFIGTSNSIVANTYAKVSVTLRVVDQAVANVYLVNTTVKEKSVVTFDTFTDTNNEIQNGELLKMQLTITSNMMDEDGWTTVNFYIATGLTKKDFRVEIWNGSRDESTSSKGFVFVKDVSVTSSTEEFKVQDRFEDTFTVAGNPLYEEKIIKGNDIYQLLSYKQALTDKEIKFNSEQSSINDMIKYRENYVWAKSDSMIYAIFNTIDPIENDPYANQEDEETTDSGCVAETDPSTFWLSFSSIVLGVALVVAILMLIIKNLLRRRKLNASDAKSHYTITSRTKKQPKKKSQKTEEEVIDEDLTEEEVNEETEQSTEETDTVEENKDESYVYGDVQVFGDDDKKDGE